MIRRGLSILNRHSQRVAREEVAALPDSSLSLAEATEVLRQSIAAREKFVRDYRESDRLEDRHA